MCMGGGGGGVGVSSELGGSACMQYFVILFSERFCYFNCINCYNYRYSLCV